MHDSEELHEHEMDDEEMPSTGCTSRGEDFVPDAVMSFLEHFLPPPDFGKLRTAVDRRQSMLNSDADGSDGEEPHAGVAGRSGSAAQRQRHQANHSQLQHQQTARASASTADGVDADLLAKKLEALAQLSSSPAAGHSPGGWHGGAGFGGGGAGAEPLWDSALGGDGSPCSGPDQPILLPLSHVDPYEREEANKPLNYETLFMLG